MIRSKIELKQFGRTATELSPATCSRSRGIRGGLAAGRVARPPLLWIAGALAILILCLSGGQIDYPTSQDFPTRRSVEDFLKAYAYNYSKDAQVFCFSGNRSWHMKEIYAIAKEDSTALGETL